MKQDFPIQHVGSLPVPPKLTDAPEGYYDRIREQKELARERLRAAGEDLDELSWVIRTLMDRRNEYIDEDGYVWKYDVVDVSKKDYACGIIVARKEFGEGAFRWFKVYNRKIYRWEGDKIPEPYEPNERFETPWTEFETQHPACVGVTNRNLGRRELQTAVFSNGLTLVKR